MRYPADVAAIDSIQKAISIARSFGYEESRLITFAGGETRQMSHSQVDNLELHANYGGWSWIHTQSSGKVESGHSIRGLTNCLKRLEDTKTAECQLTPVHSMEFRHFFNLSKDGSVVIAVSRVNHALLLQQELIRSLPFDGKIEEGEIIFFAGSIYKHQMAVRATVQHQLKDCVVNESLVRLGFIKGLPTSMS